MALSTLTARVDEHDKADFDSFCSSVGLTTSAAINIYVKTVLREKRIPFEIKQEDPFFDPANQAYVLKSVKELRAGKGTAHEIIEDNEGILADSFDDSKPSGSHRPAVEGRDE